jgi:hypothetical protein
VSSTPSGTAAAFEVEGRVLSTADGAGVPGAGIVLTQGEGASETRADAEGRFRWSTDTLGTHQLTAIEAPGFASFAPELGSSSIRFEARAGVRLRDVTLFLTPAPQAGADAGSALEAPDPGVDLSAEGRGRVAGTAREADSGRAIAAFSIVARARKGAIERGGERHVSFFDSEGRYVFTGLRPGAYCLTAVALGRATAAEQCVEVGEDGEARADFALGRGAKLSGSVVDRKARAPIAGARVSLERPFDLDTGSPLPVIASVATDAQGAFELSGLDTGVRSIFVSAAGHHSRVLPGIQLDPDRAPPPLEVDLLSTEPGEASRIESAGINAAVQADGDTLVIWDVSPEGGAAQAGLRRGDVLVRVDGAELSALGMQAGVERLRGPEGSTVVVTIRRPPDDALRDVVVTRRRVVNREGPAQG